MIIFKATHNDRNETRYKYASDELDYYGKCIIRKIYHAKYILTHKKYNIIQHSCHTTFKRGYNFLKARFEPKVTIMIFVTLFFFFPLLVLRVTQYGE